MRAHLRTNILVGSLCALFGAIPLAPAKALDCKQEIAPEYLATDPASLIHITDDASAHALRANIIDYIWSGNGFPQGMPQTVIPNSPPLGIDTSTLTNFSRVDEYWITMRNLFAAHVHHFHPTVSNGRLVILHQGHSSDFSSGGIGRVLSLLIEQGFAVITSTMPGYGGNFSPKGSGHTEFNTLHTAEFNPLEAFLEPLAVALNYVDANYSYTDVSMTGLSGGGWTTMLYAAIDPRVTLSIPVAGSVPLYLRQAPCPQGHDWEQKLPGLYGDRASYLDLYILGSFGPGRRQVQYLNQFDTCCFWGITYQLYEQHVIDAVAGLSVGSFEVYLDTSHSGHQISIHGQAKIMREFGLPVYEVGSTEWQVNLRLGTWQSVGAGFNGSAWVGSSNVERYWLYFRDLEPGTYRVMATWVPDSSYASNARFEVSVGNQLSLAPEIDQRAEPDDFFFNGFGFETLGEMEVATGAADVKLTGVADGPVVADTVLFLRVGDLSDSDEDGILSNADGAGAVGDVPCTGGNAEGCDDNCRDVWNPAQVDSDFDGVGNACDNCIDEPNPLQIDADLDGFGNRCDADYDNDGSIGSTDFAYLRRSFGSVAGTSSHYDAAIDANSDGAVTGLDFFFFLGQFRTGAAPGPSALQCAGLTPCE